MNPRQFLTDRWQPKWNDLGAFSPQAAAYRLARQALDAGDLGKAAREELVKAGQLSPKGIAEKQRAAAAAEIVPKIRRSQHLVQQARAEAEATRASLGVPKPDPTDVAAAIRRMEIRQWMRGQDIGDLGNMLMAPDAHPDVLAAAFELPAAMTGLPGPLLETIQKGLIERTHATELQILDEMEEAAAVAGAAAKFAMEDLIDVTGFSNEKAAFNSWMELASRDVDRQIETEVAKQSEAGPADLRAMAEMINKMDKKQREALSDFTHKRVIAAIGMVDSGPIEIPDFEAAPAAA